MHIEVQEVEVAQRLDLFLRTRCPDLSRSRIQTLVKGGVVRVNGCEQRQSYQVQFGDCIDFEVPEPQPLLAGAEDIPVDIVYEDSDLLVVNKAAGMTVHPAPGARDGTLVNALLHHCSDLSGINGVLRPGIVHRLDKDTSGLMVVAKSDTAHRNLAEQIQERTVERRYVALVWGVVKEESGTVDAPLGRNPKNRKKMGINTDGRRARTHYEIDETYAFTSLLKLKLDTGRTHQIRVHLEHLGHAVFGDPVYGGREQTEGIRPEMRRQARSMLGLIKRQALHARDLRFSHPRTGEMMRFNAEWPRDMGAVVEAAKSIEEDPDIEED
ncbi:MAG: RluA family pseudouridine synthase [Candidatus Latescibacterota bacterium]|jgi:23S rRNA pseudouridine1911/1915/1917 synthase